MNSIESAGQENPFQVFATLGNVVGDIQRFSENPTLEQLGVIDDKLVDPRDQEFFKRLKLQAETDPGILKRVYDIRQKLNHDYDPVDGVAVLRHEEAKLLLEDLKCKSFGLVSLRVKDCELEEIDLEDAIVGKRLVFSNVTTGKNNQRNMFVGQDHCQVGMIIHGDNDQSGMQVGDNQQENVQIAGTNYQNGMRINGENRQISMSMRNNEQMGVLIGGNNFQEIIKVEDDNTQEMTIGGRSWQIGVDIGRNNRQKLDTGSHNNQVNMNVGADNSQILIVRGNNEQHHINVGGNNKQFIYVRGDNIISLTVLGHDEQAITTLDGMDPNLINSITVNGDEKMTYWTARPRKKYVDNANT